MINPEELTRIRQTLTMIQNYCDSDAVALQELPLAEIGPTLGGMLAAIDTLAQIVERLLP